MKSKLLIKFKERERERKKRNVNKKFYYFLSQIKTKIVKRELTK